MKKILLAVLVIAVVAAIAVGGTVAYFSATSNDVTASVTMGTATLKAGGPGWVTQLFDMKGVVPGQSWTQDVYVQNTGSAGLYITPTWTPATGNMDVDGAIEKIAPVMHSGATAVPNKTGVYYLAAGDTAYFTVTITVKDQGNQNDLQGKTLQYKGGFYGATTLDAVTAYTVGA